MYACWALDDGEHLRFYSFASIKRERDKHSLKVFADKIQR